MTFLNFSTGIFLWDFPCWRLLKRRNSSKAKI